MDVYVILCWSDKNHFWGIHSVVEEIPTMDEASCLREEGCFARVECKKMRLTSSLSRLIFPSTAIEGADQVEPNPAD